MTTELVVHLIPECDPARFARLGAGLLDQLQRDNLPRLVLAPLEGDGALLGRFQRAQTTIDLEQARRSSINVTRRLGGGRAIGVGQGTLGLLLGLPHPGFFLPKPIGPDRLLNRHVRGLLAGLTAARGGAGAHYFGRDFVSAESRQIAVLSQDGTPSGAAVLEAFVGVTRSLELPAGLARSRPHRDARSSGPAFASLSDLWPRPLALEEVARLVVNGYTKIYQCVVAEDVPLFTEGPDPDPPAMEDEWSLAASALREVPIGFVEALVRADGGRILQARLQGDFIAPAFTVRGLEASLAGCSIDAGQVGVRVDAAFRARGATILGLTSLRVVADALLEAAGKA